MSTEPEVIGEEKEPSPYIRTFAKDVAALTEKNPEIVPKGKFKVKPVKKPKPVKPTKAPKHPKASNKKVIAETAPDSLENELDSSVAQMQREGVQTQERSAAELISLPAIQAGDIIQAEVAAPQPSQEPKMQHLLSQLPTPQPPVTAEPVISATPAEPTDAERAAILARLKSRVENHDPKEAPALAQAPEQTPEPILPEVPQPQPIIPHTEASLASTSPLHTYKSDFADEVKEKHASPFTIIAAEKDAPSARVPRQSSSGIKRNSPLPVVIGTLLLIAGLGGVYGAYLYAKTAAPTIISPYPPSLLAPNSEIKLTGSGSQLLNALSAQSSVPLPENNILLTYVDESTTTPQGVVEAPATGGAFISQLNLPAPDILLRNIDPSSMVGIVHAGNQTKPFFILRVLSYERTFAGMLQWESTMFSDLQEIYPLYPSETASTSASSSSENAVAATDPNNMPTQFIDEVVDNHSVRALRDSSGRTLLVYGYADKQTLIIARDELAFTLLLGKLATN